MPYGISYLGADTYRVLVIGRPDMGSAALGDIIPVPDGCTEIMTGRSGDVSLRFGPAHFSGAPERKSMMRIFEM